MAFHRNDMVSIVEHFIFDLLKVNTVKLLTMELPFCASIFEASEPVFIQRTLVNTMPLDGTKFIAPFVKCTNSLARHAISFAKITPDDVILDLGCGDGQLLWTTLREVSPRKLIGVELDPFLFERATELRKGCAADVELIHGDMFAFDYDAAGVTVMILYLLPAGLEKLKPKLLSWLSKGNRVITIRYEIPELKAVSWKPDDEKYTLFKYFSNELQ